VRIMMGTLVEVGRGRRPAAWVGEVLAAESRAAAGPTAPAHGLTLWHVTYPEEFWL
jgi:tRNA pseudouridine38-40 synthase